MGVVDRSGSPSQLSNVPAYLLERDAGPPTNDPQPLKLDQINHAAGWREDRLFWDYADPTADRGSVADGFVVFASYGTVTTDPTDSGFLVAITQRSTGFIVPATIDASYAIAAMRLTHGGPELGTKLAPSIWAAPPLDSVNIGDVRSFEAVAGTKDGVNCEFTVDFEILLGPNGSPLGQLLFRRAPLFYVSSSSPKNGEWTLAESESGQTIVVGEPPHDTDYLAFSLVVGA